MVTVTSPPILYAVKDAAPAVGLSRASLYLLMGAGEIEWIPYGKKRLIPREALEDFAQRLRDGLVKVPAS